MKVVDSRAWEQPATFIRGWWPPGYGCSIVSDARVRPLNEEHEWLQENERKYPGCWLAVLGRDLLAASPDLRAVLEATRRIPGGDRALLHFVATESDRK